MREHFKASFELLMSLEHRSSSTALHKNKTESNITFMGIYRTAHPSWSGWSIVDTELAKNNYNLRATSRKLMAISELTCRVMDFYKTKFWDRMKLDEINDEIKCKEIFLQGVNSGTSTGVKIAQKTVGVTADGQMGSGSITAINNMDTETFSRKYDKYEIDRYESIARNSPKKRRYLKGWKNRARAV